MPTVATGITEPSGSMKDGYAAATGVGDDHDDHVDVDLIIIIIIMLMMMMRESQM